MTLQEKIWMDELYEEIKDQDKQLTDEDLEYLAKIMGEE